MDNYRAMKPLIHLALTHDWELRGDGSGDIEQLQFAPLRTLLQTYRKHRAATTFLPDVMQQLKFRRLETRHPELKITADSWDDHVREAYRQGHDIQLHLHPQWHSAEYENGSWRLNGDWSILKYDREAACAMLAGGKQYLENLLRPLDSSYRCLAFRACTLATAPSPHLFKSLAGLGFQLEVSIAAGLIAKHQNVEVDYRNCEETFLPFYPVMEDARRVSDKREEIVCVPLNHFYGSRWAVTLQNISLARQKLKRRSPPSGARSLQPTPGAESGNESRAGQAFEKLVLPALRRKYFVSDTASLNYTLMREMLTSIRHRARASGLANVPVVLTNHPKYIRDFLAIERFVGEISQAEDIEFITLTELSGKLRSGEFQVRTGR